MSLPVRERGLKCLPGVVAPHSARVAPCAGAWVEIPSPIRGAGGVPSLPVRERGLKLEFALCNPWDNFGRSLCGSVG